MAEKQYDGDGEWDFADEGPDTSAMQEVAGRFADGLHAVPAAPMTLDLGIAKVRAIPGITSTSKYEGRDFEFLGGCHSYTVELPNRRRVEVSLQLWENKQHHHRLFAYVKKGMLFSLNLTLGKEQGMLVRLEQQLKIVNGRYDFPELAKPMRSKRRDDLVAVLRGLGYEVSNRNWIDLGTYDVERYAFMGTTGEKFIRDFLIVALLKGHFMGNKGYTLE